MTNISTIQLTCPVCDTAFESTTYTGERRCADRCTDFRPRVAGMPLTSFVHTCAGCGYSGSETAFGADADVSFTLQERVRNELTPRMCGRVPTGSEKYEAAARIAEWTEAGPGAIAELHLRAAWCCVEEEDVEAERYFRLRAARSYEAALETYALVEASHRALLAYLVGEIWRRVGDDSAARYWFDRVESEIVDWSEQEWIADAARQQRDFPREWF